MRRPLVLLSAGCLVACGVFGTAADSSSSSSSGGTPASNATPPPLDGTPVDGIFVSSSRGDDAADGTADHPLKTLKAGMALGKQRGQRVIACAEPFVENVELVDGVSMYGYFDCSATPWKRADVHATVKAPASPAVAARGLQSATRFEGFDVVAPDLDATQAKGHDGTSIALYVRDTQNLAVSLAKLHGGKGAPGAKGVEPANNVEKNGAGANGLQGKPQTVSCSYTPFACGTGIGGGGGGASSCAVSANGGPGGAGGDGRVDNVNNTAMDPHGRMTVATAATALGGAAGAVGSGATCEGKDGSHGANGADGDDGTNGTWSFDVDGFIPGDGAPGKNGLPGQGGGGGGAAYSYFLDTCPGSPGTTNSTAASGSGGGAGGCAGIPGTAGGGGGASLGALVVNSTMRFENTRIEASEGGAAGKGTAGGVGLTGGGGAVGVLHGGYGGTGGTGGASGLSGHGAPGPSIALAFSGTRPDTSTNVDLAPGNGGQGQAALAKTTLNGTRALPGNSGESKPEHSF